MRDLAGFSVKPPATLLGNWREETVLQQERLKEYDANRASGRLLSSLADKRDALCAQPVRLGAQVAAGAPLVIASVACSGALLAVDVPLNWPHPDSPALAAPTSRQKARDAAQVEFSVAAASVAPASPAEAPARCAWVLRRTPEYAAALGDASELCFGDKVTIEAVPELELAAHHQLGAAAPGASFYLASQKSLTDAAGKSNLQRTLLTAVRDTRCVWQLQLADPDYRLEVLGRRVTPEDAVLLVNTATNAALYANPAYIVRNAFGVESEVSCGTVRDQNTKAETPFNQWRLLSALGPL